MKIFVYTLAVLMFLSVLPAPFVPHMQAQAQSAHRDVPLVVIRFNQARVFFQKPLANAVKRARDISPGVKFRLVHFLPASDYENLGYAGRHVQVIVDQLKAGGVDGNNIIVEQRPATHQGFAEVHVFVMA